jgi:hypothetical protein
MFPTIRNNWLVKYPFLLTNFIFIMCVLNVSGSYILIGIVPIATEFRDRRLAQITFTLLAIELIFFGMANYAVCSVLLRLFQTFRESKVKGKGGFGKFAEGERTVRYMRIVTVGGVPFMVLWALLFSWLPLGFRFSAVFLLVVLLFGNGVALVSTYTFVFRMGSKAATKKNIGSL